MTKQEVILNEILDFFSPTERESISLVYNLAEKALQDKKRENGAPFIEHPLGVASILAKEIGMNSDAVIATFLHEAIRFNEGLEQSLPKGLVSSEMIDIAKSLNKIAAIKPKDTRLEADNYKRLIVSYSKDPRVTIIKLADRLDVMRNLSLLPKSSQERKVAETIMLYIPLAHQLGLYRLKSELEDIFFKNSEPEHYRTITNKLKATQLERNQIADSFIKPLAPKLEKEGITCKIKGREKTAYSIWKKMNVQGVPFEGVNDILAIRIIIDTPLDREKELCWKVYSIVTEEYIPDPERLRDWITTPKPNGYESLHTTVHNAEGTRVEVQIRSKRMDEVAENGHASHWSYKGIKQEKGLDQWLLAVRTALESSEKNDYRQVSNFVKEEVFVFTPNGELRRLPEGACVLDFAFDIHSNLGAHCSGAKVDGKLVSIREKLHTGNIVEILTNKNQKPSDDWLNFVVTSKARSKIRQTIKEDKTAKAEEGKEMLERRLKNWKMELPDEDLTILCKRYKLKSINDFFTCIGNGNIDIMEIKEYLREKLLPKLSQEKGSPTSSVKPTSSKETKSEDPIILEGNLNKVNYKFAKCCNPLPGDDIFGFVSIKDGVKIHKISCPNAGRLIDNFPYRIIKAHWKK